ncbi:MAG: TIGR03067 domain-containing protein [Betaproteobacteria bacterium]
MKTFNTVFLTTLLLLLASCAGREFKDREPVIDRDLNGTWLIRKAELGGKKHPLQPTFELQIAGSQYRAGTPPPSDRGKIILFGDELAGQAARMDVVGEDGPNKGKRYPAIYRFVGRELEICYDLSEKERPSEFVSREGTMLFRVTYYKK